ncbi:MAG: SusC/RagA family TonB-linked outer membrane protein, partial [Bacteroidales bacterium]
EARVAYARSFGKHSVDGLALYTQRTRHSDFLKSGRKNYNSTQIDQIFAGPIDGMTSDGFESEEASAGVVGRFKYDYDAKYIMEFSFRYDGSDKFAPGHRWGFFPALSGVWIASDEEFMKPLSDKGILNLLKLRASYGETGLSTGLGRFKYIPSYSQTAFEDYPYIGGALQTGYEEGSLVNPSALSWYTRTSSNVGFDFASLNNSLEGSLDYFYYNTKGFLMSPKNIYSGTLGTTLPEVRSETEHRRAGMEFSLKYRKNINKFHFEVGGNLSYYQQLYVRLDSEPEADLKNPYVRLTHQTDYFDRVYLTNGFYNTPSQVINAPRPLTSVISSVGEINYIDSNGDGKIDSNDLRRAGNSLEPHLAYGFNFNFRYEDFSLSGLFQGVGRRTVHIGNVYKTTDPQSTLERLKGSWTPENTDALFPRYFTGTGHNGGHQDMESDVTLFDGSYLRLKNITLSYNLKNTLLKNVKNISGLSISLIGTNLLTFSEIFKYFDPESLMLNSAGGSHRSGGGASYPVNKTYSLAVNLEF